MPSRAATAADVDFLTSTIQAAFLDDPIPDHRGQGRGQQLLAESLALWDAEGMPAYLESTNAANDHRYVRAGFRPDGGFRAVRDDTWVTAMWRPAGSLGPE
jgi:L-amino acid N-acyltransferase YncA